LAQIKDKVEAMYVKLGFAKVYHDLVHYIVAQKKWVLFTFSNRAMVNATKQQKLSYFFIF